VCRYFTLSGICWRSSLGLGDEEIISKNKETINNPAIAAPIIIGDPISFLPSCYASVMPLSPSIELSFVFIPALIGRCLLFLDSDPTFLEPGPASLSRSVNSVIPAFNSFLTTLHFVATD